MLDESLLSGFLKTELVDLFSIQFGYWWRLFFTEFAPGKSDEHSPLVG